jgi:hypothetical protein
VNYLDTTPWDPTITEPGIYEISDAEYHMDPVVGGSLSSTGARRLLPPSCPAKFRWYADHPEEKDIFDFGKAAHQAVLGIGPEIVGIETGPTGWNNRAAKAERDSARAEGKVAIKRDEADIITQMATALRQHPIAGRLFLPGRGVAEQTVVWRDRQTGIWRRARLDWVQGPAIVDYKTCDKADDASCARAIHNFGYHQQADFYIDGATEVPGIIPEGKRPRFILVFQEKTAPYLVNVVEPDAEALSWGAVLNAKAIDIYRRCTESGMWPGYAETDDHITFASLPPYAITNYERARQRGDYDTKGESFR